MRSAACVVVKKSTTCATGTTRVANSAQEVSKYPGGESPAAASHDSFNPKTSVAGLLLSIPAPPPSPTTERPGGPNANSPDFRVARHRRRAPHPRLAAGRHGQTIAARTLLIVATARNEPKTLSWVSAGRISYKYGPA